MDLKQEFYGTSIGCVQYGGEKELATLPHSTPGLVRIALVVWGMQYVYLCVSACAWVCGYAHLVPATGLRADSCTYSMKQNEIRHKFYCTLP
jgi:hypothetical protein